MLAVIGFVGLFFVLITLSGERLPSLIQIILGFGLGIAAFLIIISVIAIGFEMLVSMIIDVLNSHSAPIYLESHGIDAIEKMNTSSFQNFKRSIFNRLCKNKR